MQKLIEGPVDFLQGRMKDSPIDLFEIKMTFLKEKPAFEIFKRWEVPGKFQPSSIEFSLDG
jgi:hypothetical protein